MSFFRLRFRSWYSAFYNSFTSLRLSYLSLKKLRLFLDPWWIYLVPGSLLLRDLLIVYFLVLEALLGVSSIFLLLSFLLKLDLSLKDEFCLLEEKSFFLKDERHRLSLLLVSRLDEGLLVVLDVLSWLRTVLLLVCMD